MPSTPMYDPLTSEARSPWLAGLTEACYKLSTILDLDTDELSDFPLSPVDERRLIYQAPLGSKLWMDNPEPVIRKNGIVITPENDYFTINYLGGSVEFEQGFAPEASDTLTADATYIIDVSNTLTNILAQLADISDTATKFKGYFSTVEALNASLGTGVGGDYAIVGGTENAIYLWNTTSKTWESSTAKVDLSAYYTKEETDTLLGKKENTILAHGDTASSDDYYYGGQKTWVSLNDKVKNVPLTGIDTTVEGKVEEADTVGTALGKLQSQIDAYTHDLFGTSAPTTTTVGAIGQDYTNTSTGDKYHLVEISGSDYIWEKYQNELTFDSVPTEGSNNPVTSGGIYSELQKKADSTAVTTEIGTAKTELQGQITSLTNSVTSVSADLNTKADKVVPSSVGNIAILGANGNLVDSGKGVEDVGRSPTQATANLTPSAWAGSSAPFTQNVYVSGILSDTTAQNITIAPYPDLTNVQAITSAYIYCTEQGANSLTFVALKSKPTATVQFNISIQNL